MSTELITPEGNITTEDLLQREHNSAANPPAHDHEALFPNTVTDAVEIYRTQNHRMNGSGVSITDPRRFAFRRK